MRGDGVDEANLVPFAAKPVQLRLQRVEAQPLLVERHTFHAPPVLPQHAERAGVAVLLDQDRLAALAQRLSSQDERLHRSRSQHDVVERRALPVVALEPFGCDLPQRRVALLLRVAHERRPLAQQHALGCRCQRGGGEGLWVGHSGAEVVFASRLSATCHARPAPSQRLLTPHARGTMPERSTPSPLPQPPALASQSTPVLIRY